MPRAAHSGASITTACSGRRCAPPLTLNVRQAAMLIGDRDSFAIECHHEPLPNERRWVFGRMCIWAQGHRLGDIGEPACVLDVTERCLHLLLLQLDSLDDPALRGLGDRETFSYLDRAIYTDVEQSTDEAIPDAARFYKFNLLTNGGESFDRTKSFIVAEGKRLRILFTNEKNEFVSAQVGRALFTLTVRGFLAWVAAESERAG